MKTQPVPRQPNGFTPGRERGDGGVEASPGCAAAPGVEGCSLLSPAHPTLPSAALADGERGALSGNRRRTEALPPQTRAHPGAFSICETGQAADSIIFS